ncbi:ribosomal RNA processing protein 36 homolog [Copidosoma floridanum]|uniref:ribosomal RNA processing protein 36 homolog n=1 Tax=Copidosoma floridanum TaxID=29053 RepID=UPI0006C96D28|nr:ribosomal RNA processing protein 36 homolog [Copidosoma floridanum]
MSDVEDLLCQDKDRSEIREELSNMSFEELQKLKEKIGTKIYNATLFGPKKAKRLATAFKRINKNRPREESAKKPVTRFREIVPVKKTRSRDPRFDSLCGEFNEKAFKNSYQFLHEYRKNDLEQLKKQLETEEDPKQIKKIKYLVQRLENQIREVEKKIEREAKEREEKGEIKTSIKQGEKPVFKRKSEKRIESLVSQFEELKNSGRLKKHIKRLKKKNSKKDRQRLENSVSE